jgi:tetratricopeptide (TPR) repeat protein
MFYAGKGRGEASSNPLTNLWQVTAAARSDSMLNHEPDAPGAMFYFTVIKEDVMKFRHLIQPALAVLVVAACGVPAAQPTPTPVAAGEPLAELFDNLGDHHHPITTGSTLTQKFFDQGLTLAYAFNHDEAIRSFQEAARLDPACAMCYWGIALALGPNINAPMDDAVVPDAYAALQKAIELAAGVSEAEQAYLQALAQRYSAEPVDDRAPLDQAYADAMGEVVQKYPDDVDAATLYAEALMNLRPWDYWAPDGQPQPGTDEILSVLESVLVRSPDHPGANHYYIHTIEGGPFAEKAIPSAERLPGLVPGAGHLVHMPAHVYWRVGRYHDASIANEHAIHADESYLPDRNVQGFYPAAYYPHNIHFLFASASMEGRSAQALDAARKLVEKTPVDTLRSMPFLEDFLPTPLFAMTRFGMWEEILAEPQPAAEFQYTTGIWHYARGLALVRLDHAQEAAGELERLNAIASQPAMAEHILFSYQPAATMLAIAAHILAGELAGVRGDRDERIAQLETAVAIQDGLAYIEPPPWHFPVRQALGAALLEAGQSAEAEAAYREDLQQYPANGWSYFGLAQSLAAQGKTGEAAEVQKQFDAAWSNADVTLTASWY